MEKIPDDTNYENVTTTVTFLLLENMKIEYLSNLKVFDSSEKKTANELQETAKHKFFSTVKDKTD